MLVWVPNKAFPIKKLEYAKLVEMFQVALDQHKRLEATKEAIENFLGDQGWATTTGAAKCVSNIIYGNGLNTTACENAAQLLEKLEIEVKR